MTRSPNIETDMLLDAAAETELLHGHTADLLADHGCADTHDEPLDALSEAVDNLRRAARNFTHYSDGRVIRVCIEIDPDRRGHTFAYTYPAIVEQRGERLLCTGDRPRDPDESDRGRYEVWVDDGAATIRVRLTGPGRHLSSVPDDDTDGGPTW
ncbi:hypothetical protein [Gordonia sp. NPDC003422]